MDWMDWMDWNGNGNGLEWKREWTGMETGIDREMHREQDPLFWFWRVFTRSTMIFGIPILGITGFEIMKFWVPGKYNKKKDGY